MGEYEELDADEPLARRMDRHAYDRLIMLSDGVFAIAITLAALSIRLPDTWRDMADLWAQLRFPLSAYLISFAVVASYWTSQRDLIARLVRVDAPFTFLALAQLLFVSLIPVVTQLLYHHGPDVQGMQLYCMTLSICGYLAAALWAYGAFRPGLIHAEGRTPYRWARLATAFIVPVVFTWVAATRSSLTGAPVVALALLLVARRVIMTRFGDGRLGKPRIKASKEAS